MRNWKLRSSVIVLAAVMMASSGCGKKNNDTASLPQLPSQTQTQEQTQEQTIEQTIPVTTEEEAIPVPVAPGEVNVSSSSSASASSLAAASSQLYRQKIATSREMKKFMRHKRLIFARQLQQTQQMQDLLRQVHPFTE